MKLDVNFLFNNYKVKATLIDNESVVLLSVKDNNVDILEKLSLKIINEIESYALSLWFDELDKHNDNIKKSLLGYDKSLK